MITPLNSVFLSLDKALNDEILLEGGLKLYLEADFNPEFNATVTGKVAGIPKHPTGECSEVCSKIKVGDEISFTYRVVSNRCLPKVNDYFMPTLVGNPYKRKWINSSKDVLMVTGMPPAFNKFSNVWVGLLLNKKGQRLDGIQGNEKEVERWLSQFKFSGIQDLGFENLLFADKQNLWRCQFTEILAKKVGDMIFAINDRIIMTSIEEDVKHRIELQEGIALPYHDVKLRYIDRARMISGGEEMGFKKGDILSFEPQYVERYEMWSKKYMLIKKRRTNGKWHTT